MRNIGSFYDKGLFYKSPLGFECLSGPAKNALIPLLSTALQQNLQPINSVEDPGMRGVVHEQWNISQFISRQSITITPFSIGTNQQKTFTPFMFQVNEIMHFGNDEEIQANVEYHPRLYIPIDKSHPAWDCIYDDGVTTAFFSFSISHFWEGSPSHDVSARKSFEQGKESQNSKILNKLRGKDGHEVAIVEVTIDQEKEKLSKNNPQEEISKLSKQEEEKKELKLVQNDPDGIPLTNIHYFYGCGKEREKIIALAGTKRISLTYQFMKFFAKEEMEKYGVQF